MIVISNGKSTRANGYLSRTEEEFKKAEVELVVFDKVRLNSLKETVMECAAFTKKSGINFKYIKSIHRRFLSKQILYNLAQSILI